MKRLAIKFTGIDRKSRFDSGALPDVGHKAKAAGPIKSCQNGFHAADPSSLWRWFGPEAE